MLPTVALCTSILTATLFVGPVGPVTPPAPRWRGVGLSIAAGVTGTVGLAVNIGRIGAVQRACAAIGEANSELESAITECVRDSQEYLLFSALAPLASASAVGLATGAGVVNGRHRGWQTVHGDSRSASAGGYIGVGAGLFGVSVITFAVAQVGLWRDLYGLRGCLAAAELSSECVRSRWSGWLGAVTASHAGAVVGAGLFAFGVSYQIHRQRQRRGAKLGMQPALSLTHVGIRLTGWF